MLAGSDRARLLAALLFSWGTGGCSLRTVDYDACTSNEQCRQAFGIGSACGDDGLCQEPAPPARCTETFPDDLFDDVEEHRNTILFASLFNHDNETQEARSKAVRLALRQLNDEGGVEGRKFGLVECDIDPKLSKAASTTEAALEVTDYLTDTLGVVAVFGPSASDDVKTVFKVLGPRGVLLMSASATSPLLTSIDRTQPTDARPGLLWRTAPPDSIQGRVIAMDMAMRNVDRAFVIAQSGAYGEALSDVYREHATQAIDERVFDGANDLSEAIVAAGNSDVDEVLFIASTQEDVAAFLGAASTLDGYLEKSVFLTDSAATRDALSDAPTDLLQRVRGTRPSPLTTDDVVYANFVASYAAEYGEDVSEFSFTSQAYDATWLVALGAAWAVLNEDSLEGETIARGLRRISDGTKVIMAPSAWHDILADFARGKSVNVRGASGALDYDPDTEETTAPIEVWTVDTSGTSPEIVADYESE